MFKMANFFTRFFRRKKRSEKKRSCLGSKYIGQNEEETPKRRATTGKKEDVQTARRTQKTNSAKQNQVGDSNSNTSRGTSMSRSSNAGTKKKLNEPRVLTPRNGIPGTTSMIPPSSKPTTKKQIMIDQISIPLV